MDHLYGCTPPVADRFAGYATPTIPLGMVVVVIDGGGGAAMVIEKPRVALSGRASTICATKENVPAAVGVPLMSPLDALSLNPAGREPCTMDQVYGSTAFLAARFAEYATPTTPLGKVVVVIESMGAKTTSVNTLSAVMNWDVLGTGLDTRTSAKYEPTVVGVPVMTPSGESVSPGGIAPSTTVHE